MAGTSATRPAGWPLIANLALAAWLLADAVRVAIFARGLPGDVLELATGAAFVMTAAFVLTRPPAVRQDVRAGTIAVALAATFSPLLLALLAPDRGTSQPAFAVQAFSVAVMAAGLFRLGRNFSILPQYRTLIAGGPYAVVRHPIYGSYLLFDGTLALDSGSLIAGALWLGEAALLLMRARLEEKLLAASDPAYAAYLQRVRWRFVPGVV